MPTLHLLRYGAEEYALHADQVSGVRQAIVEAVAAGGAFVAIEHQAHRIELLVSPGAYMEVHTLRVNDTGPGESSPARLVDNWWLELGE